MVEDKGKPAGPREEKKQGKPTEAIATFVMVLVGAILLLAYPFVIGSADAAGILFFIFGLMLLPVSWYVFKVEYWSWGSVLIVLILALLLAVPTLQFIIIGYGIALAVVLFVFRRTYGVGVWKLEREKDNLMKKEREKVRTSNPQSLHCPRCKSVDLYICDDGSTFCRNCKTGVVDIKDLSAKPKSTMPTSQT